MKSLHFLAPIQSLSGLAHMSCHLVKNPEPTSGWVATQLNNNNSVQPSTHIACSMHMSMSIWIEDFRNLRFWFGHWQCQCGRGGALNITGIQRVGLCSTVLIVRQLQHDCLKPTDWMGAGSARISYWSRNLSDSFLGRLCHMEEFEPWHKHGFQSWIPEPVAMGISGSCIDIEHWQNVLSKLLV